MRILILDIDGLQPAYLGPYGCEWAPTPVLDAWAAAGVVFDQHFADCPDPAHAPGWRTGWHPLGDGVASTDLLDELRGAGIRSAIVGPARSAGGFEISVLAERGAEPLNLKPVRRAVRAAIDRLGDSAHALLRVEIEALLPPWRPAAEHLAELFANDEAAESVETPEPWTGNPPERIHIDDDQTFDRLQRTFAAAVATLDENLGRLFADCSKRGWGDDATWIFTSSRGFPLGEHGAVGFSNAELHEELIHLPLLVRWPRAQCAGLRTSAYTQPMDLAPTLRDLFGLALKAGNDRWSGRSLLPLARGDETPLRDYAVSGLRQAGRTKWGYRAAGWYLMLDDNAHGSRRLFVKPDDRWEVNDVSQRNQDLVEKLEQEFHDRQESYPGGQPKSRPPSR